MFNLIVRNYQIFWTNRSLNDLDKFRLFPYVVRDILDDHWESKKIDKKKDYKFYIIGWVKGKWLKIRFRIYEQEKKVIIIMLEKFTKVKK